MGYLLTPVLQLFIVFSCHLVHAAAEAPIKKRLKPVLAIDTGRLPQVSRQQGSEEITLAPVLSQFEVADVTSPQTNLMASKLPLKLIKTTKSTEVLSVLPSDLKGHIFLLDLDNTVFGFDGFLDSSLPGVLQEIAERGAYIMVATARDSALDTREYTHASLLDNGVNLELLAARCAQVGGFRGFPNLVDNSDEEGKTMQFYNHMMFVGGGTLVGIKGSRFENLCERNGISVGKFKGISLLDDSKREHRGFHDILPVGIDFTPFHACFEKENDRA